MPTVIVIVIANAYTEAKDHLDGLWIKLDHGNRKRVVARIRIWFCMSNVARGAKLASTAD